MIQAVWLQLISGGELRVEFFTRSIRTLQLSRGKLQCTMLTKPTEIQDRSSHEPECWS